MKDFNDAVKAMITEDHPEMALPIALNIYEVHTQVFMGSGIPHITLKSNDDAAAKTKAGRMMGWDDYE